MRKMIIIIVTVFVVASLSTVGLFMLYRVKKLDNGEIAFYKTTQDEHHNWVTKTLVAVSDDRVQIHARIRGKYPPKQFYKYTYRIEEDSFIFNIYYRYMDTKEGRDPVIEIMCDTQNIQKVIFEGESGELEILWDRLDETLGVETW